MQVAYIPAYNILGTLELGCNGTECRRNNGLVQRDKEDGNAQRKHGQAELHDAGVDDFLIVRVAGIGVFGGRTAIEGIE